MGMFDTFILKEPLKCMCGQSLDRYPQTRDLSCDMMEIYQGKNTAYNGLHRKEISLSKFHGDEVEIEEDCAFCKGFTRFNVIFDEQGYWQVVPKEHRSDNGDWFEWKDSHYKLDEDDE